MHLRFLLTFLLTAAVLAAQSDLATIRGTALDPSGAVIPKVKIELTNTETNTTREAVTNSEGDFEIPYVSPGNYRLRRRLPDSRILL